MSTFDRDGQIDPHRGVIVSCFGKKRSGKSVMGLLLFAGYPYDRVVIDPAGDDGPVGPDVIELHGDVSTLPRKWPESRRRDDQPMTLRYVPDAGSPTFLEDVDAVVGMVMHHGRSALLVHEVGLAAPVHKTPPHMRRLLNANRHRQVTAIFCGPRPVNIDPLVLAQSDLVYTFELPNPNDRERVASTIGWDPGDFALGVDELGPHEYLLFDGNMGKPADGEEDRRLVHMPALPAEVVADVKRWAAGHRAPTIETVRA